MLRYKIASWRFFVAFVVTFLWKAEHVHLASHQSHLCEATDMPCQKENVDDCRMKYYKLNSTDCRDMPFSEGTSESSLGNVWIEPYHYNLNSYKQTGFNLSFTDINWSHLKFRFQQEGNEMINTCREFVMSPNSTIKELFYDCLWSKENYEGMTFSFEYEATDNETVFYRKYSFRVPFAKNIDEHTKLADWEIFIIVEIIKFPFGLPSFILHWQPLPERFSINNYQLKVYSNESGDDKVIYYKNITCNSVDECKYEYSKWFKVVQFGIQPICSNESECSISRTAVFLSGGRNTKTLLIGIMLIIVVVPTTIYLIYCVRNCVIRKSEEWMYTVPKVLIIFTPSLSSHVNVVFALVDYLQMYCNVEPLIDELHIFLSKSRDPFKWCNEAFRSADVVMVVASPYHKYLRLAETVYQNTDLLLLRLLRESLASREDETRFCVLMLPYCSEKDIPREAINLRRFYFPEDLNKIMRFIHKDKALPECMSSEMKGGKETYKASGKKLSKAIAETQESLKKNIFEYERMVKEIKAENESSEENLTRARKEKLKKEYRAKRKSKRKELIELLGEFPVLIDEWKETGKLPQLIDDFGLFGDDDDSSTSSQKSSGESDTNLDALEL